MWIDGTRVETDVEIRRLASQSAIFTQKAIVVLAKGHRMQNSFLEIHSVPMGK